MWHDTTTARPNIDTSSDRVLLIESAERWVLTRIADPRLEVGTVFEHRGVVWTVVWESDSGFGCGTAH